MDAATSRGCLQHFHFCRTALPGSTSPENGQWETAVGPPGSPRRAGVLSTAWPGGGTNTKCQYCCFTASHAPADDTWLLTEPSVPTFLGGLRRPGLQPTELSCERSHLAACFTKKCRSRSVGPGRVADILSEAAPMDYSPQRAPRPDDGTQRAPRPSRLQDGGAQGWLGLGRGFGLGQQRRGGGAVPGGCLGLRCAGGGVGAGGAARW